MKIRQEQPYKLRKRDKVLRTSLLRKALSRKESVDMKHRLKIAFIVASVVLNISFHEAHAEGASNVTRQCVDLHGLSINDIGLWARLPEVIKNFGEPLRIEYDQIAQFFVVIEVNNVT